MKYFIVLFFMTTVLFAARLNIKTVSWDGDPTAVKFRVYCASDGSLDYDDPFVELQESSLLLEEGVCGLSDGNSYMIGITQYDDYGHESTMSEGAAFNADFSPLPVVTNIVIN